jgi:hypothetical protein
MEWLTPILVAIIGGPLVVVLQQLRKENKNQHGELAQKIDKIDEKLDNHIHWHLTKTRRKKDAS